MKSKLFIFALLYAFALTACNSDVQLGTDEDLPKIAEHALSMPTVDAIRYMEQQGFIYEGDELHKQHPQHYIFSRDPNNTQFSTDAAQVVRLWTQYTDSVKEIQTDQKMPTRQKAYDLYWKWSRYTAKVTNPPYETWNGVLTINDSTLPSSYKDKYISYIDGSIVEQDIHYYTEKYNNGEISKEQYEELMAHLKRNREVFWRDYQAKQSLITNAYERYSTNVNAEHPKQIEMHLLLDENGDWFELYYQTRNVVFIPMPELDICNP